MEPTGNGVSGASGCNRYNGTYKAEGVALHLQLSRFTDTMCSASVMARENAYLQALSKVEAYGSVSGNLMLARVDGQTLLEFNGRFPPAPTTTVAPTATVGSSSLQPGVAFRMWALTRFSQDGRDYPLVANVPITLWLDEQRAIVGGGIACHGIGGPYVASGAMLRLQVVDNLNREVCAPFSANLVALLEGEYLVALGVVTGYRLEDGQLALSSGGARLQLTYRQLPCPDSGSAQARGAFTLPSARPLSGTPDPATPWPCPVA
jgi:heat shock protein HslJ